MNKLLYKIFLAISLIILNIWLLCFMLLNNFGALNNKIYFFNNYISVAGESDYVIDIPLYFFTADNSINVDSIDKISILNGSNSEYIDLVRWDISDEKSFMNYSIKNLNLTINTEKPITSRISELEILFKNGTREKYHFDNLCVTSIENNKSVINNYYENISVKIMDKNKYVFTNTSNEPIKLNSMMFNSELNGEAIKLIHNDKEYKNIKHLTLYPGEQITCEIDIQLEDSIHYCYVKPSMELVIGDENFFFLVNNVILENNIDENTINTLLSE